MKHQVLTKKFLGSKERVNWHNQALLHVRFKRDNTTQKIREWEELREIASQIKLHVLSNIKKYVEQFYINATKKWIYCTLCKGCRRAQLYCVPNFITKQH